MIDAYSPTTLEQKIIHLYAIEGSVTIVANKINEEGHKVGSRKYTSNDVSSLIMSKPEDELHEIAQRAFKNNKKATRYLT
ncbi:hypothetical protein D3C81_1778140 [compost metagenome]